MPGSGQGTAVPDANVALTIDALRNYLWDLTLKNNLLGDQEWESDQLTIARQNVIDKWNGTPPDEYTYTLTSFPDTYVYYWKRGAAGEALRMAAFAYARNELPYSAGGVNINDNAKVKAYLALAQQETDAFDTWMHRKKLELDAKDSFLTI